MPGNHIVITPVTERGFALYRDRCFRKQPSAPAEALYVIRSKDGLYYRNAVGRDDWWRSSFNRAKVYTSVKQAQWIIDYRLAERERVIDTRHAVPPESTLLAYSRFLDAEIIQVGGSDIRMQEAA